MTRHAVVSGGFDPVHSGHVRMILEARALGPVIVILNSDDWLARKKGQPFMSFAERSAVISAMRGVEAVVMADDADGTVCATLRSLSSAFPELVFCNGGDRTEGTTPELSLCHELGIDVAWDVGGGKTQSSSEILSSWRNREPA